MDKHLQVQGLRRMIRPVLLDSLAALSVTCYMFVILCIDSSKSYNDFSFQKVHLYKTKIIMTAEKEPNKWLAQFCTTFWDVKHVSCNSALSGYTISLILFI